MSPLDGFGTDTDRRYQLGHIHTLVGLLEGLGTDIICQIGAIDREQLKLQ